MLDCTIKGKKDLRTQNHIPFAWLFAVACAWWVCDGCMVGLWWVCDGCVMDVWWVCDGCVMGVWWVCNGRVMGVWWVCDGCMMGVWWVCNGYVMGVWWVCDGCVMGVWWVCDGCVMGVWWVYIWKNGGGFDERKAILQTNKWIWNKLWWILKKMWITNALQRNDYNSGVKSWDFYKHNHRTCVKVPTGFSARTQSGAGGAGSGVAGERTPVEATVQALATHLRWREWWGLVRVVRFGVVLWWGLVWSCGEVWCGLVVRFGVVLWWGLVWYCGEVWCGIVVRFGVVLWWGLVWYCGEIWCGLVVRFGVVLWWGLVWSCGEV